MQCSAEHVGAFLLVERKPTFYYYNLLFICILRKSRTLFSLWKLNFCHLALTMHCPPNVLWNVGKTFGKMWKWLKLDKRFPYQLSLQKLIFRNKKPFSKFPFFLGLKQTHKRSANFRMSLWCLQFLQMSLGN